MKTKVIHYCKGCKATRNHYELDSFWCEDLRTYLTSLECCHCHTHETLWHKQLLPGEHIIDL
jgi:hypothetical protein